MGLYSNFLFAEPADLVVDLTKNQLLKDECIVFEKPCTLTEFGKSISGWKLFGYFDNAKKQLYRSILDTIHEQHPTIAFKLHFWYEDDILFYFYWENGAKVKYGEPRDCRYFLQNEILQNITGVFHKRSYLIDRYNNHTCMIQKKMYTLYKLSQEDTYNEDDKLLLYLPTYLKYNQWFRELVL